MPSRPLGGVRVTLVTATDVSRDGRVQKEARSLVGSGAQVTVIGQGNTAAMRTDDGFVTKLVLRAPRFGSEAYPWLVRVPVNLFYNAFGAMAQRLALSWVHPLYYNPRMVAAVVESRPDVIHCHNVYTVCAGMEAVAVTGAKLIYDVRELFSGYFTKLPNGQSLQAMSNDLEQQVAARAGAVLTVSPLIAQSIESRFGRGDARVLYNSLPYEYAEATPAGMPVRILNQAAMRASTEEHQIVQAMSHLRDVATLSVQGRFQAREYEQYVHSIIEENGLADVVELAGPYDALDSVRLATGYDIGVMVFRPDTPNKRATMSNRFFTYLNAGLALAFPDVPAYAQFPGYDEFGILLDTSSPETIATGLRALIDDPERIARMKRAALDAAPRYAWEQQEQKLIQVYRELLGR